MATNGTQYDNTQKYITPKEALQGAGGMLTNDSSATQNAQPSKSMNSGSYTIDGANPSSPSTNNATRRERYNLIAPILNNSQGGGTGVDPYAVAEYNTKTKSTSPTTSQILGGSTSEGTSNTQGSQGSQGLDLALKGNFDIYQPIDRKSQPKESQAAFIQANNDLQQSIRALSKAQLDEEALGSTVSSNVKQVSRLIDAIENAYDRGIFDTNAIASQLGVSPEAVSLVQKGKANELVKLNEEYVQDKLKSYYRAGEDYDIQAQRTFEDYTLAKTNLDYQYSSTMQKLKRNLFNDKRAASVGSAIVGLTGSEYAVQTIEKQYEQNMNDINNNYLYSSTQQQYQYTRAMEDYARDIERLSEDFDDSLKQIQSAVLQQFQEIDNRVGLSTQQMANIYGRLLSNTASVVSNAEMDWINALYDKGVTYGDIIAQIKGVDTSKYTSQLTSGGFKYNPINVQTLNGGYNVFVDNLGDMIEKNGKVRSGECGALVNDYLKTLGYGTPIGNDKASKLNLKNLDKDGNPSTGSIVIWDKPGTDRGNQYGHVAIFVQDNGNGTIKVLEQNVETGLRYKDYNKNNIYGYFDPTIGYGEFEKRIQEEKLQSIYDQQSAKESAKSTTQTGVSAQRDYSGLTNEQIMDVDNIATEILGATQAAKDVATHNAIAQMMREGKTIAQIKSGVRDRVFGDILNAYPETKAITQFLGSSLTKTQKEDFQDVIKDAISNNNPQEAFSFIKTTLKDQMNTDTKKSTQATELLLQHAQEIEDLYNKYIEKGGETSWLSGTYENFLNKFGETSDPDLLELYNKIQRAIMTFRHDISGAAFTESEGKQYEQVFPNIKDTMEVFLTKVKSIKDLARNDNTYYYDSMLGGTGKYNALQQELSQVRTTKNTLNDEISKTNQINLSNLQNFASNVYTMLFDNKRNDTDSVIVEETPKSIEQTITSEFGTGGRIGRGGNSSGTTLTGTFAPHF